VTEEERRRLGEEWLEHHRAIGAENEQRKLRAIRDRLVGRARLRTGKRGPRKGDGGRPALTLDRDPDRKIIVAALWWWRGHDEQQSFKVLQWLDALFTPYGAIKLGTETIDGETRLTVENTSRDRHPGNKRAQDGNIPDRRLCSAVGREALRKSRLGHLRDKVDSYRSKTLDEQEAAYFSRCAFAFLALAAGDYPTAMLTFASAGWEISEVEGERLREIFTLMSVDN
jgi:hypothetical protein